MSTPSLDVDHSITGMGEQGVTVFERLFARGANATGGTDGERKLASIRQARSSLINPLTKERQIAIEGTIIAGT